MKDSKNVQESGKRKIKENAELIRDAVNSSDVQFFTYFPEKHRLEIHFLNTHYRSLPTTWDNYPESFISYMKMSLEDGIVFRNMISQLDAGASSASCTTNMLYEGTQLWIRTNFTTVRDAKGKIVKAPGYSLNVNDQKLAEERIQKERLRLKTLEGKTFEAFSFNITKNSQTNLQTTDSDLMTIPVRADVLNDANRLVPVKYSSDSTSWQVMIHVANRIPDREDRIKYLSACSLKGMHNYAKEGKSDSSMRYRRYIGDKIRWVSSHMEILPDPASGDLFVFFYSDDITDQIVQEKIGRRVIDDRYIGVVYLDLQTKTIHVESAGVPLVQKLDNISYDDAYELISKDSISDSEQAECRRRFDYEIIIDTLRTEPVYTFYFTSSKKSELLPAHPNCRIEADVFYLDEHKDEIVFLFSDVTAIYEDERETRERMAKALHDAESANSAKSDFLSRMSHDIRTPLNGIIGMTRLAKEQQNPAATTDYLEKIDTSSKFLLGLINDILDMAKAESGMIELHPQPYSFDELLSYMNAVIMPLCKEKNIKLIIDAQPVNVVPVADIVRVNQIYFNIFSNAVKFTPEGGTIKCRLFSKMLETGKIHIMVEISDTGIGMSPEFQKNLFQPFMQENRSDVADNRGTGLGLSIVKKLVDLMKGKISVQSELGKGTTFSLSADYDCIPVSQVSQKKAVCTDVTDYSVLNGRHILLCEDHPLNQEIAKALLQEKGMIVDVAENGERGMRMFEKSTPGYYDSILMDIRMPVMDGYESTKAIRSLLRHDAHTVPIIAMTADAFAEDVKKALCAGMNAHISKPIDADLVYKTLVRLIGHTD